MGLRTCILISFPPPTPGSLDCLSDLGVLCQYCLHLGYTQNNLLSCSMNWLGRLTIFTLKFLVYKIRSQSNDLLSVSSCDSFFFFKSKHGPVLQDKWNLPTGLLVNCPEWLRSHISLGFCYLPGTRRTAWPPHPSLLPWFLDYTVSFQSGSHAYPAASARALSRPKSFLLLVT